MDERIIFVISMVDTNIQRPLNMHGLAAAVNLSSSRLRHLFRTEKGTTLAKYQRDVRLQTARVLLVSTFLTIKEVMNLVGISDNSHFNHEFKKAFGVSPGTYRIRALKTPTLSGSDPLNQIRQRTAELTNLLGFIQRETCSRVALQFSQRRFPGTLVCSSSPETVGFRKSRHFNCELVRQSFVSPPNADKGIHG